MDITIPQKPLDIFSIPLEGKVLLEASAGTGKTYTLSALYLRLVVEAGLAVNRILVVTYTKAATAELRDRIRGRLVMAREAFLTGETDDLFFKQLLSRNQDHGRAAQYLANAVLGFDEAAIFTIHGFCQRILAESAFESGMAFEAELVPSDREILQEIADDFWRQRFYQGSPLFVKYLLGQSYTPERLLSEIIRAIGRPYLTVLAPPTPLDLAGDEDRYQEAHSRCRAIWQQDQDQINIVLSRAIEDGILKQNIYKPSSLPIWITSLNRFFLPGHPDLLPEGMAGVLDKFTQGRLSASVKKGKTVPEHPFFAAAEIMKNSHEILFAGYGIFLINLKAQLLDFCRQELPRRKRREQIQSYDDLLLNLDAALQRPSGEALAKMISNRFQAALIDEFQDTDPVQYRIFSRIYQGTRALVFLVGDPKQAIYSFRGADVFSYIMARKDAGQKLPLNINWRSDPSLIRAVNALFAGHDRPFLLDSIRFQPVHWPHDIRDRLVDDDDEAGPLRLWVLRSDDDDRPLIKGEAHEMAFTATATAIADLLARSWKGMVRIGGRGLAGGDIAVLVYSHRQGRAVRDCLRKLGVASVMKDDTNVFAGSEAEELCRILTAIAEPGEEARLRAALATELLGATGEAIHSLALDERAWETVIARFHTYHRLWCESGFMRMFRHWLVEEEVAPRLLTFPDGEQRLTNLLHLAELLQDEATRRRKGRADLIQWFIGRCESEKAEDEEAELRLESDANRVQIVTIHKSKGLEYPMVFCPFLWSAKIRSMDEPAVSFHDPTNNFSPFLDLGTENLEQNRFLAAREELAEQLRLLYVALTRARYRCVMICGKVLDGRTKKSVPNALGWLLHGQGLAGDADNRDLIPALADLLTRLTHKEMEADLYRIASRAAGAIVIEELPGLLSAPLPAEIVQETLAARTLNRSIRPGWSSASFSSIIAGQGSETADHDQILPSFGPEASDRRDRFTFPRGARAGTCLHLLFEKLDFTRADIELPGLIPEVLEGHGIDKEWSPVVQELILGVLTTELTPGLRLDEVKVNQRLTEMGFTFTVDLPRTDALTELLAAHGPAPYRNLARSLSFPTLAGFLKGFIDLVFEKDGRFFLVDYKSNWLGNSLDDYRAENLLLVMARDHYFLQYLLYTVALHRYLTLRLPDYDYQSHFGGVFYLFLRGITPERGPGHGVFFDRPDFYLVTGLCDLFDSGGRPPTNIF